MPNFQIVLSHVRGYFVNQYHSGTRAMVCRYVNKKMGDVPPMMVSAALKTLKKDGAIVYDKKVWWFLTDK